MALKKQNSSQKLFVIKTYQSLKQIQNVVKKIAQEDTTALQLSILGKLTTHKTITKEGLESIIVQIKQQLSIVLGAEFQSGYFFNPEIGSLFIAGHLTPTFLNKVEKREIASIPVGLLGIFKGLGIDTKYINSYLRELKNDSYCLIIRGKSDVLDAIEPLLVED